MSLAMPAWVPSRSKTLNQRRSDSQWEHPKASIGYRIGRIGKNKFCWEAVGPARELFDQLGPEIKDFLESCGKPLSHTVIWSIFMIGKSEETSAPKVIFSCVDAKARKEIRKTVEESSILANYPGIGLGDSPVSPDLLKFQPLGTEPHDISDVGSEEEHVTVLYNPTGSAVGTPLFLRKCSSGKSTVRRATAGGKVYISGKAYYWTVDHVFDRSDSYNGAKEEDDDEQYSLDNVSLDDDSDTNAEDDFEIQEMTSRGSLTPDIIHSNSFSSIFTSASDGDPYTPRQYDTGAQSFFPTETSDNQKVWLLHLVEELLNASNVVPSNLGSSDKIVFGSNALCTAKYLDCALFEIKHQQSASVNTVRTGSGTYIRPTRIAHVGPDSVGVLTATSSQGLLRGRLSATPSYLRNIGTSHYQRVFTVRLEGIITNGDCGAWVIDSIHGSLYGHIIGGCPGTGKAYIIPAIDVVENLELNLGKGSVMLQPSEEPLTVENLSSLKHHTGESSKRVPPYLNAESANRTSLVTRGLAIVAEELAVDVMELGDSVDLQDLGVDSLSALAIAAEFRYQLKIDIASSWCLEYSTVGQLKDFLVLIDSRSETLGESDVGSIFSEPSERAAYSDIEAEEDRNAEVAQSQVANSVSWTSIDPTVHSIDLPEWQQSASKPSLDCMDGPYGRLSPNEQSENYAATSVLLQGRLRFASKNLFLLPPGFGSATNYVELPKIDSRVAVFGLNSPFMKIPDHFTCDLPQFARMFITEIKRRQIKGPYILGGWSIGGIVAYEVATQLIAQNEKVESLILLDAPCPLKYEPPSASTYSMFNDSGLLDVGALGHGLPEWMLPHNEATKRALRQYQPQPIPKDKTPRVLIVWAEEGLRRHSKRLNFLKHGEASSNYLNWLLEDRTAFNDPDWMRLLPSENIIAVLTKGNHFTMLRDKDGQTLVEHIRRAILGTRPRIASVTKSSRLIWDGKTRSP